MDKKVFVLMACALSSYSLSADQAMMPEGSDTVSSCSFMNSDFARGDAPLSHCPHAYSTPAQIMLDRSHQMFMTASYIFWNAEQDGMDLATTATFDSNTVVASRPSQGKTIFQEFDYNSGFKIGFGYGFEDCDNWTLRLDYTWLYQHNTTSKSAPSSGGANSLLLTNWFAQSYNGQAPVAESLHSSWHLGLNWLDLVMSRAFYQGKKIIATPFAGLRASFMSQSLNVEIDDILNFIPSNSSVSSKNKLSSWGIGPRMGVDARYLIGAGFRLQGEVGGSLLFTEYGKISHSEGALTPGNSTIKYQISNRTCLRPLFEANLGIGWGSYFSRERYHIDLSATYDFNYLWQQNMMRSLNDLNILGSAGGSYDLSFQGLTLSADFAF